MSRGALVVFVATFSVSLLFGGSVAAGGGCHNSNPSTDASATAVLIKDCGFAPTVVRVPVGATVTWTNADQLPHVVSGVGWGQPVALSVGSTFSRTFTAPGIYPYSCYLHPGMEGAVVVGDATASASARLAPADSAGGGGTTLAWPLAAALSVIAGATGFGFARHRRS